MDKAAPWPQPNPAAIPFGSALSMRRAGRSASSRASIGNSAPESSCPQTGILWQNRGNVLLARRGAPQPPPSAPPPFPHHPARPRTPQRRPRHGLRHHGWRRSTPDPAMLFSRHVLFNQPLQEAVTAPRWLLGQDLGRRDHQPQDRVPMDPDVIDQLKQAGHQVELSDPSTRDDGPRRRLGVSSRRPDRGS